MAELVVLNDLTRSEFKVYLLQKNQGCWWEARWIFNVHSNLSYSHKKGNFSNYVKVS